MESAVNDCEIDHLVRTKSCQKDTYLEIIQFLQMFHRRPDLFLPTHIHPSTKPPRRRPEGIALTPYRCYWLDNYERGLRYVLCTVT